MKSIDLASSPASKQQAGAHRVELPVSLATAGVLAAILCVVGTFTVYSSDFALWRMWVDYPLKSVGAFVPFISFILILRVWRSLGWEMEGSWWGLLILAATIALVHLRDVAIMELVLSPSWSLFLPPHSVVAVAYAAGAAMLFGGTRLLWKARFPIALMWLVDPIPNYFSIHIDLPLQHASSLIARSFAHLMGQQLTPDQLFLMFTPQFGMFIAPGCNGIRGAVTMGMIALVAGYLYQFKPQVIAAVVAGAVLLGYLFNLVRLCSLVLYYIVALHIPWLQSRATMGDYIIGATLFFFATALLFTLIQKFGPTGDVSPPALPMEPDAAPAAPAPRSFFLRWAAFAVLIAVGSASYARVVIDRIKTPVTSLDPAIMGQFPQQIGDYRLVNRWNETLVTGPLIFYWADYARDDGTTVSVGLSPILGAHDTLLCHAARGEDWAWHGNLPMMTKAGEVGFSGSFFSEGDLQYMEATTVCTGNSCGQYSSDRTHFGLVYSRPDTNTLLTASPTRPMPVMLRTQTKDPTLSPDAARRKLTGDLQAFLAAAQLQDFTRPYRVLPSY
jgi:exosortase J